MIRIPAALCGLMLVSSPIAFAQNDPPPVTRWLTTGRLQEGAEAMQAALDTDAGDQQARFSLGVVQFLQAIEGLGQDHHRYGLVSDRRPMMMFLQLPIPENASPEEISAGDARQILQRVLDQLAVAEQTLAQVTSPDVVLPLPLQKICLDINSDGKCGNDESLGYIIEYVQSRQRNRPQPKEPGELIVGFDAADAAWLRGYCHVMSAVGEMILAYDWTDQFERTAHLLYPRVHSPYPYLAEEGVGPFFGFGAQNLLDAITFIHTINYEVLEPERMSRALSHWEQVIRLSRQSWQLIQQETDNFNEWLPGPDQTAVITAMRIGQELIGTWHQFLDELEAILQGKKLVPFWRGVPGGVNNLNDFPQHPSLGINVRRIFTEPGRFDLALWLQGTGLDPWLEEGDIVDPAEWNQMLRGFGNNFWPIVVWFN